MKQVLVGCFMVKPKFGEELVFVGVEQVLFLFVEGDDLGSYIG